MRCCFPSLPIPKPKKRTKNKILVRNLTYPALEKELGLGLGSGSTLKMDGLTWLGKWTEANRIFALFYIVGWEGEKKHT